MSPTYVLSLYPSFFGKFESLNWQPRTVFAGGDDRGRLHGGLRTASAKRDESREGDSEDEFGVEGHRDDVQHSPQTDRTIEATNRDAYRYNHLANPLFFSFSLNDDNPRFKESSCVFCLVVLTVEIDPDICMYQIVSSNLRRSTDTIN